MKLYNQDKTFRQGFQFFLQILIIPLILLWAFSCKKDKDLPPAYLGYDFFPFDTSQYVVYDVQKITWDDFYEPPLVDTQDYQVKEVSESFFTDNEGRKTLRIERYKREHDTTTWQLIDVWMSNRTNSSAERMEENTRYVKLVFPIKYGQFWDGNSYNILEEQTYEYQDIFQPYSIDTISFDSTVSILQNDEFTLISNKYAIEVYARKIGMVYKRFIDVKTETNGEVKSGIDITMKITSSNKINK